MTRPRPIPNHRDCTECGQPVVAAPGTRHLSCSPTCAVCHLPVPSTDQSPDNPRQHRACTKKRTT